MRGLTVLSEIATTFAVMQMFTYILNFMTMNCLLTDSAGVSAPNTPVNGQNYLSILFLCY